MKTILRRMTQLVTDLRTLNVLKEGDVVEYKHNDDGYHGCAFDYDYASEREEYALIIRFAAKGDKVNPITVKKSIEKEFEAEIKKNFSVKIIGNYEEIHFRFFA